MISEKSNTRECTFEVFKEFFNYMLKECYSKRYNLIKANCAEISDLNSYFFVNKHKWYGFKFQTVQGADYRSERYLKLQCVFSVTRGKGDQILTDIVYLLENHKVLKEYKRITLNCFDGYLTEYYSKIGFTEYMRGKNYTQGEPDVVYMEIRR